MRQEDYDKLVKSIKQVGAIKKGEFAPSRRFDFGPLDIKVIRENLHQSKSEFAMMIGVSVSTLQNWEQRRRRPEGPAKALLRVVSQNPRVVMEALLKSA